MIIDEDIVRAMGNITDTAGFVTLASFV